MRSRKSSSWHKTWYIVSPQELSPMIAIKCCFIEYFLYWGGSREPLPNSENLHFCLNMTSWKCKAHIHWELTAKHMSLLASTRRWEPRCGIPKTERACCTYIVHAYILNQGHEKSKKWIKHRERWKGPLPHLCRSRKGVNTYSLIELRSFIAPLYTAPTSPSYQEPQSPKSRLPPREHSGETAALEASLPKHGLPWNRPRTWFWRLFSPGLYGRPNHLPSSISLLTGHSFLSQQPHSHNPTGGSDLRE